MEPERLSRRWEELLGKIRKSDVEGARSCLERFCRELKEETCYKTAKIYTLELLLNLSGEFKRDSQVAQAVVELDYKYLKEWENKGEFEQFCHWVQNDVLEGYLEKLNLCNGKKQQRIVEAVKEYIEKNYESRLALEDMANYVYLSPCYLTRLFREGTGCRIFDYITAVRLKWAKEYLAHSGCRITEVAQRVGFEDASYFGKVFRKEVGVTPSEYRDLHQSGSDRDHAGRLAE